MTNYVAINRRLCHITAMKWSELLAAVGEEPVFSTGMLLVGNVSPPGVRRQLDRWVKAGKIRQLRRGVYTIAEPYRKASPHPFLVANRLKAASYVTLESALSYHAMIPESVAVATSVTTGRPEEVDTPLGRNLYRHVKRSMFFGFAQREVARGQMAIVALPEKALIDLLYLTPGSDSAAYLRELRLELPGDLDWSALRSMARRVGSRKVMSAVQRLGAGGSRPDWEEA